MEELIVDFCDYRLDVDDNSTVSDEKISELGKSIVQFLETLNFCYLINHGFKEQLIRDYMEAFVEIFKQSPDESIVQILKTHTLYYLKTTVSRSS